MVERAIEVGAPVDQLLLVFFIAMIVAFVATPVVRRQAVRTGLVDRPGQRRMHSHPVPKGGGVAIYAAFWIALFLGGSTTNHLWPLFWASTLIVAVGLIDDRFELRWYQKLAGQVLAAIVFVLWGGQVEFVTHPFAGTSVFIGWWGIPVTIVWLVALANMVNLIDGLDGLAAGVAIIACVPLLIVALTMGRIEAAFMTAALGAATLGFFPYNFNPARIIMGDSGAMFLGFALGAISVEGALKGPTALAFVVPALALGLPIFDTVFAIVRRWAARKPFYQADADHLHHRLLAMGLSHKQAVLTLYGVSAIMGIAALLSIDASALQSTIVFCLILLGSALFVRRVGGICQLPSRLSNSRRIM